MSNYGQDRLYGAIDDDDDFLEEWRSSWEPASHTRVDEVMEQEVVTPESQRDDEDSRGGYEPEGALSEADVTWGSWQSAPAMAPEPETITEVVAAMEAAPEDEAQSAWRPEESAPEGEVEPASQPDEPTSQAEADEPQALTGEPITDESESAESEQAPDAHTGETEAESGEPDAERLVAPDDAQEPDLVDWEPEPTHPAEQAAGQEPDEGEATSQEAAGAEDTEAGEQEPATVEEPEAAEETPTDHGTGLTGAAAAALAAASAWGVWGGTPAVPSMPAPSPFPVAEPDASAAPESEATAEPESEATVEPEPAQAEEPEAGAEPQSFEAAEAETEPQAEEAAEQEEPAAEAEPQAAEAGEQEPFGLYVPEPEVLRIPEPQPSADEPEAASFSPGLVTTPIPEPDMYAAPGMAPFTVPEPEPYVIPEPQPSPEPSPVAQPTGDTTPIPEPGFVPESLRQVDAGPIGGTDPTLVPHEQVHVAAGDSDAYDLHVDVYAVLGFPPPAEPTPPAEDSAVPDTQGRVIVNDDVADSMVGRGPEDSSDTRHDGPAAEDAFHEEATSD
ncbi:MAG TPA: hypothetical protein VFK68_07110, partial [Propionibacteriaceae bacterium]|nr:hypothetical protein [Propionibacteriaceae bacterium]